MRVIDPATQALLDSGIWIHRGLAAFDMPDGVYGLWDGAGDFTWNTITFVPGASLIEVDAVEESGGLVSVPLVLRLRSIPDTGLSTDLLATIEDVAYHFRPVTFYLAFFDPDTRALASVETVYRGRIDRLRHLETGDGDSFIEAELTSYSEDYTKTGVRIRSTRDQQEISAGDKGFEHVGDVVVQPPYWGGEEPRSLRAKKRRRRSDA